MKTNQKHLTKKGFFMKKLLRTAALLLPILLSSTAQAKNDRVMFNIDTIVYTEMTPSEKNKIDYENFDVYNGSYNEQMYGIGASYLVRARHSPYHWFGVGFEYYDDQFENSAYQLNGIYKFRIPFKYVIDGIEFNFKAGLVNRLYVDVREPIDNVTFVEMERETRFGFTPSMNIAITKNFTAEVIYMPEDWSENITDGDEMLMVKLGLRL